MAKRLLIFFIIILAAAGALGLFGALKYRTNLRQARQSAKAAEIKITLIEGWNTKEIADYLDSQQNRDPARIVSSREFLEAEKKFDPSSYPLLASKPASADLEGFLFPDTYFIPKAAPAAETLSGIIIKKALDNFSLKFTAQMQEQAKTEGYSIYQIITLASIIEKETGRNAVTDQQKKALNDERGIIAGIFYNRLKAGMPLQSDATVNYITGKNSPSVSDQDTKIDSPYNTYLYKGLPPGPIANPSLSSIMAALYPTASNYLYFLHKQPSGEPVYSATYEEHLKNKQKYLN